MEVCWVREINGVFKTGDVDWMAGGRGAVTRSGVEKEDIICDILWTSRTTPTKFSNIKVFLHLGFHCLL